VAILPRERFDDIRYALDPGLDEVAVDDEIIASVAYLQAAEQWVLSVDPLAASRTGGEQEYVFQAIIFRTAGLLSYAVPQARQVNMAGHNVTLNYAETPAERSARLFAMADLAIGSVVSTTETIAAFAPVFVTTVQGRRA
jgi:hypothetical protein